MTKQRKTILNIIQNSDTHLTAEQVFLFAKQELPTLSLATTYRNLGQLAEAGAIQKISVSGADRYDRNLTKHAHLICENCGEMTDVTLAGVLPELERRTGQKLLGYELTLHYLCPRCSREENRLS